MANRSAASQQTPNRRPAQEEPAADRPPRPRRTTFWLGALLGAVLGIPAAALLVRALAPLGSARVPGLVDLLRLAAVFAGLPGAVSGGGVARVAARAHFRDPPPSRRRIITWAAAGFAPVGAGMVLLTGVAAAAMPEQPIRWLWLAGGGLGGGLAIGAIIGAVTGRPPVRP
jgi:hypothetical protein